MGTTLVSFIQKYGGQRQGRDRWRDLDGKRWILLGEKEGGKEGEMEEWDLVEGPPAGFET